MDAGHKPNLIRRTCESVPVRPSPGGSGSGRSGAPDRADELATSQVGKTVMWDGRIGDVLNSISTAGA
jgi:hypothetical protein